MSSRRAKERARHAAARRSKNGSGTKQEKGPRPQRLGRGPSQFLQTLERCESARCADETKKNPYRLPAPLVVVGRGAGVGVAPGVWSGCGLGSGLRGNIWSRFAASYAKVAMTM